jgi:hypothetical protein
MDIKGVGNVAVELTYKDAAGTGEPHVRFDEREVETEQGRAREEPDG